MSYGGDFKELLDRAAALIDRIFKGAKPADLPFEEPTHYPFVVNLKTAKINRSRTVSKLARTRRRGDRMKGAHVA